MAQQPPSSPISNAALVLRFTGFLVVGVILLNLAFLAIESYFKFSPGNMTAMGFFLMWGAASWTGQLWFLRERALPESGRAWTVAALCAVVTYLVQALFMALAAGAVLSQNGSLGIGRSSDQMILLGVLVVVAVVEFLLIRLGIGIGAKGALKRAERQTAKTGA